MIHLFKLRTTPYDLGHLESQVMQILWRRSECNVREVVDVLPRPLAYTTVMTTLDRLFKKGMLDRHKKERAFVYSARFTRSEWELKRADTLMSCLVDAVGPQEAAVLDNLENKIRIKRSELEGKRKP